MTKKGVEQKHSETAIYAALLRVTANKEFANEKFGPDYKEFLQTMKKQHAGEKLMFAIEENKIEAYLKQRKLIMIDNLSNKEIEKRILLNESGTLIGKITGLYRFVMASPKLEKLESKNDG